VAAIAVALAACSGPSRPSQPEDPAGPNTLTAAERSAGWRLLFDGASTSGWRGFRQSSIPPGWQAIDGALTRTSGGGDIVTIDQFADFELSLEWQIAPAGNSGIMFRVSESADATFQIGPEMQVLDNAGHPDGASPLTSAGACYGLYAPSANVARPAGAYELGSADWLARLQASPFRDVPGYGREPRGHIALQDHGDRVAYRSIKLRVL
jgi:hypothetical protein